MGEQMRAQDRPAEPAGGQPVWAGQMDHHHYVDIAVARTTSRIDGIDELAMRLNIILSRVVNARARVAEQSSLAGTDLSWTAFRVLYGVWLTQPTSAGDVARLLELNRQTTASAVAGLRRRGFMVADEAPESDGRLVPLRVSDEGARQLELMVRRQNRLAAQWASVLSHDEQRQLIDLLARLTAPASGSADS